MPVSAVNHILAYVYIYIAKHYLSYILFTLYLDSHMTHRRVQ